MPAVLFSVFKLDAQLEAFVKRARVEVPQQPWSSRLPTPAELRSSLQTMPSARVDCFEGPSQRVRTFELTLPEPDGTARLIVNRYAGENAPCSFYFEQGTLRVALEVLRRVTQHTGPLVLVPDADGVPIVVDPHLEVASTASRTRR